MFSTKLKVKYIGKDEDGVKKYKLLEPLVFENITVPIGFHTDFATIPKKLQWLYTPQGKYSRSAVVHDYLYTLLACPKNVADDTFLRAMKADKVGFFTRYLFYLAVRFEGEDYYNA